MNKIFQKKLERLQRDYNKGLERQAKIWKGFDEKKKSMKLQVAVAFGNLLNRIDSDPQNKNLAVIDSYDVDYSPQKGMFKIQIRDWHETNPNGEFVSDEQGRCASYALGKFIRGQCDEMLPEIREFMREYLVNSIYYICNCGSDHK